MELRTHGMRSATILLVCLLLLTTGSMVVAAQTPDAGEVIQAAYAAVAEKDIDTAMTYVADDMVLTLMPPPAGINGVFIGKAAVREWWEALAVDNGRAEFSDVMVSGSRVTWRAKWYADTFDALGVGPAEFEGVGVAQNGLLQSATWIFTEEFLARFEQANQLAANEALAHRYLEEMWDNGDMEVADAILADEFIDHYPLFGNAPDKAGLMADATNFHNDGAKTRIEDLIVTEDTIVIRGTVLMPDANGDLQAALEATIFLSVADGQIIERRIAIFGLQPPPPPGANTTPAAIAAEGTYAISGPPIERMTAPSDDGCLVNVVLPYAFSGVIAGTAEVHLAVLGQGPCEEMGPGLFDETVAAKGTFTGTVDDKAGTFEFLYGFQGQANQPFNGFIQIIPNSGTGELEGIQGEFMATGDPLNGEPFVYVGNYSWAEATLAAGDTSTDLPDTFPSDTILFGITIAVITNTSPFGQYNGVDYLRYEGELSRTGSGLTYTVPFEVVAPADPAQGNGRLVIEPYHYADTPAGARDLFLTPDFLFAPGFSHAGICWGWEPLDAATHPCTQIEGGTEIGMQIIADFAHMFKSGQFTDLVGTPSHLYSIGFSNSTWALFPLINDPLGENLFDLSLIVTTGWPVPIPIDFRSPVEDAPPHVPSAAAGKVMVLLTEGDIALWGPTLRDDATNPLYRAYEVAGAAHIPPPFSSAVNWTPVLRALFVAGDQWVTEGVEPPASIAMESANADVVDPVYGRVTGIARDEDLNALGGIRLPDLALGRGQFIAVDTETLVLLGTFIEQKCALMADGSPRFPTHEAYVDAFTAHTEALVAERLLLPSDAERLIEEAMSSDVGVQENCATSASE